jgi:hypothetical protein
MKYEDLPDVWKDKIIEKYDKTRVDAFDFEYGPIEIFFEDESYVRFNYCIDIVDEARDEILILTEHCGYHIFPLGCGRNKVKKTKR